MGRSVYASIQDLRGAGLSDSQFPDERVTVLLELASAIVENITKQYFGPVRKAFRVNGLGKRIVEEENRNKIVEIESISVVGSDILREFGFTSDTPHILDGTDFTSQGRLIRLRPRDTNSSRFGRSFADLREIRFPHDDKNVEIVGVFGWLELEERFETTLSQDLASGSNILKLDDTGVVEKHDLLLIDGRFWVITQELTTPSQPGPPIVPGTITVDPSPKAASAGVSVIRYGKVPLLVRQAVIRTTIVNSLQPGSDEEADLLASGRIRREETDNYEVEFFQAPGSAKVNTGTGDPKADAWLSDFRAPTISVEWV